MTFEPHSGYVQIADERFGATLSGEGTKLLLEVQTQETEFMPTLPESLDTVQFIGSKTYFTLLRLFRTHSSGRLGLGRVNRYEVQLAIQEGLYDSLEEIQSSSWLIYIEDIHKIQHVTGFQQTITLPETGNMSLGWFFTAAASVPLECPSQPFTLYLGQDFKTGGDQFVGPTLSFRYPARLEFESDVGLDQALRTAHRVRLFFSLVMGRSLAMDEISLRIPVEDGLHSMQVHGYRGIVPSGKPDRPIANYHDASDLAGLLDAWLRNFDRIQDAVHLHFDGLEQRRLSLPLRFQLFVQSMEALHRRTAPTDAPVIDPQPILDALRACDVPSDVIDRITGTLAHAHEPGLRQRVKHYWDAFPEEVRILRPALVRGRFASRVAATRNYYAHGLDRDSQVLEHDELWNHTELLKALSHLALLREIGAVTDGVGARMVQNRFTEFSLNS